MWIFTTLGFFSVVAHRDKPDCVLVRARSAADLRDLVQLLPESCPRIEYTPDADYLFRIVVPKAEMASVLASLTEGIDYDNFKNAVAERQGIGRARVYHDVWADLLVLQAKEMSHGEHETQS